ncbi:hypothetical protein C8J57DRAFT_1477663 [Mycena rebaudengoi]|nr:hypothetical protein C8J57DRAFT_1477663 [Mycena rebaudengoi]
MSTTCTAVVSPPSTRIPPDRLANLIFTSKTVVAAAELLPFPYLTAALGPVIPILEAVQKMAKNREDFTELCTSIVEIITLLQEQISRHGADAASRLTQFCEQLKSLLQEIEQGIGKFQNPERKGFRTRFKEFGQSTSIGDALNKYKSCVHQLQQNFITSSVAQLNMHGHTIQAGLKNIALTRSLGSDHEDALLWLASCTTEWLLIFDNTDDPKLNLFNFFSQSSRGNILITSRNPQLCLHAPDAHHRISDLDEETAVRLLLVSAAEPVTSETERLATEIVKVLHCFPLAVVQAGAYILKTQSLRRYLALYEQSQAQLLSAVSSQSHDKYAWSVYTTWDISFKCLSKQAAQFMQLCSFLHHEGISEGIFSNAALYSPELLKPTEEQAKEPRVFLGNFLTAAGTWDTFSFSEMAAEIQEYSLISRDPHTGLFSIHPLVHSWSRNTVLNVDAIRECTAALLAMSVAWDEKLFTMRLLPHINSVLAGDLQLATRFPYPYQKVYYESGNFQRAQELCEDLLEEVKDTLGAEHPKTLDVMASLAAIYGCLGRVKDMEVLEVLLLEKKRQGLGPEHPDTLTAMEQLAGTYLNRGNLTDAEQLELVVLERRRQALGPDHPDTLTAMMNVASTYWKQGKLADAEELEVVVLEKRRQTFGPEHPDTLTAMGNLAATYWKQGKLTHAEELLVVVLEKWMQTFGLDHPDTLKSMGNLAATYRGLGRLAGAEELALVVLEKRRQTLGPEHPHTLIAMRALALTYCDLGKITEAIQLLIVVVEARTHLLGPMHSDLILAQQDLLHCQNMDKP